VEELLLSAVNCTWR